MKLNSIVTNLELSKKLKEAGIEQDGGLFYWENADYLNKGNRTFLKCIEFKPLVIAPKFIYRAFTVNELLEIINKDPDIFQLDINLNDNIYECQYDYYSPEIIISQNKIPQDALGQLVLELRKEEVL